MLELSKRVMMMDESQTIGMARKTRELGEKGIKVISLTLGEPDFNVPEFAKEAAIQAIQNNYSHYTPIAGYTELRKAIARKFERDNQLNYTVDEIVASTGAKQSIANAVLALVNPGDEVIIPMPFWVSYTEIVKLAEGEMVFIPTTAKEGYKFSANQLERVLTEKSKLLIFSNPCNPSGAVYEPEELAEIAKVVARHPNLFVISDEIYELIRYEGSHKSFAGFDGMWERTVTVNGMSKGFAMTGWRLGYIGAPLDIARACDKLQGQFTSAPNSIAQMAAITALDALPKEVSYMLEAFRNRRKLMFDLMKKLSGFEVALPGGAFYLFPDISYWLGKVIKGRKIETSTDFCMLLLEEAHVGTVPGDAFGSPNSIRLSYATSEDNIKEAIYRISEVLKA